MWTFEERENQSSRKKISRSKERTNMKLNTHWWPWPLSWSFLAPKCAGHWWNYVVHKKCRLPLYVVYWTPTVMQKYDRNDQACFHPSGDWYSVSDRRHTIPDNCKNHNLPVTSVDTLPFRPMRDLWKLRHQTTLYSKILDKTLNKIAYLESIFLKIEAIVILPLASPWKQCCCVAKRKLQQ